MKQENLLSIEFILLHSEALERAGLTVDENDVCLMQIDGTSPQELVGIRDQILLESPVTKSTSPPLATKLKRSSEPKPSTGRRNRLVAVVITGVACLSLVFALLVSNPKNEQLVLVEHQLAIGHAEKAVSTLQPILKNLPSSAADQEAIRSLAVKAYHAAMLQNLVNQQFEQTIELAKEAEEFGIDKVELLNLESQAIRKIPNIIALAEIGRLDHFGVLLQAPYSKALPENYEETQIASRLLRSPAERVDAPWELQLNFGHSLLANDPRAAEEVFDRLFQHHDILEYVLKGRGLARFLNGKFSQSAEDFQALLALTPDDLDAQVNLALALEYGDDTETAMEWWEAILKRNDLSPQIKNSIENRLRILHRFS